MEDILNIGEWEDASSQTLQIYSLFIKKAILEDSDRQKLKKDRGFSDETIDLCQFKSCRPENRELINELQTQFGEEALLEAGLLQAADDGIKPCGQLLGTYNSENKFVNNICIPYFNADGGIFYIRPHKFGLKDKGINIYCPTQKISTDKTWIITESEFKAAAALQFGFPAIGLPGIHSFAVSNFDRLQEFIINLGINNIVIIFDNEIKTNPEFKNYKPNVLKQWDTQWRAIDICRKLLRKIPDLNSVKIGVLPASWMVEGKIDIDGALAQGRTEGEFKAVIYRAVEWSEYLETLPTIARQIVNRKIYLENIISESKAKKRDNCYYIERTIKGGRDATPTICEDRVSNFTMEIRKTLVEGSIHIREIIIKGRDGNYSKPIVIQKGINILRDFKVWMLCYGDYHFDGNQDDLDQIWKLEGALADDRKILRPEQIGHLRTDEQPGWLFGKDLIIEDGEILLPDKDVVIWDGLVCYSPRSIREDAVGNHTTIKIPIINLDNTIKFGLPEFKDAVLKIEKNFNNKFIRLAIGWMVACLFSDEIHRKYQCFPILFIGGKREAGKSTLGNWLMAMAGQSDTAGDSLSGTSPAGAERNLTWFSSLPYWLDEYRNNTRIKKWDGFFRNAYQRQAPSKGTLGNSIKSHSINAGIILSGEETPQDNALLSRCIVIPLASRAGRDRSNDDDLFREIESLRTQGLLSRLILEVIKVKKKLLPTVLDHIDGWKKRLLNKGVGERIALNYAIPAVCYDAIFLRGDKEEEIKARLEFTQWVVDESHKTEVEKESEHMLAVFMEDLITLHDKLTEYYDVYTQTKESKGKKRMAIHFPTFYSIWSESYKRKGVDEPFKRGTILNYIKEEPYFVRNELRRVGKKPMRATVFSLDKEDKPPDSLKYLAEHLALTGLKVRDGDADQNIDEDNLSDAVNLAKNDEDTIQNNLPF